MVSAEPRVESSNVGRASRRERVGGGGEERVAVGVGALRKRDSAKRYILTLDDSPRQTRATFRGRRGASPSPRVTVAVYYTVRARTRIIIIIAAAAAVAYVSRDLAFDDSTQRHYAGDIPERRRSRSIATYSRRRECTKDFSNAIAVSRGRAAVW